MSPHPAPPGRRRVRLLQYVMYAGSGMEPGEPGLDPCYSDPCYSEDGVDFTLIRWMLSLTPAERLEFLEDRINDILTIREWNART